MLSSTPSKASSDTMEKSFSKILREVQKWTWDDTLTWAAICEMIPETLTKEEATELWKEYAESKKVVPFGDFQSYFLHAGDELLDVQELPSVRGQEDGETDSERGIPREGMSLAGDQESTR